MSKLPPRNPPVNKSANAKNTPSSQRSSLTRGGAPDIRRPQKGDLPGCIHTRPLVDFGMTWADYADYIRDQARSPNPDIMGSHNALLIMEGVGPADIMEQLDLLKLAFIGSDLLKWVVIPVQGEFGLLPVSANTQVALDEVAALILDRASAWNAGHTVPTLVPRFAPLNDDPDLDLEPEQEIYHRDGEALDLFRTSVSISTTFVRQGKALAKHLTNAIAILECDPVFQNVLRFDELDHKIHVRLPLPWSLPGETFPREWRSTDSSVACAWIASSQWDLQLSTGTVKEAINVVARRCSVHKVRDRLKVLKWDGVSRIGSHDNPAPGWLATYFRAPNEGKEGAYIRLVGRYWLMSAVARAYEPGCKVDTMLILEGAGGEHKSTGMALLCSIVPGVVKDTPIDFHSKDKYQQLDGAWVYELAELSGITSRQSADELKAYVSSPCDNYRRSFGEQSTDNPRHSVFFSTVNPTADSGYLNERSGNERRNWPVPVGVANMAAIGRDRDQIWAEAVHLYRMGAADRLVPGLAPIKSRYWTAKDDAHLWEHEGKKRARSGDAMVDMIRAALFEPDAYFENDVRAQAKHYLTEFEHPEHTPLPYCAFERPWRGLSQDYLIKHLLTDDANSRDGRRLTGSMRELGFVVDVNKRVRQLCNRQAQRHPWLGGAEQDAKRRRMLYTLLSAAEAYGAKVQESESLSVLKELCFEALPTSLSELTEEQRQAAKSIAKVRQADVVACGIIEVLEQLLGFPVEEIADGDGVTDGGSEVDQLESNG